MGKKRGDDDDGGGRAKCVLPLTSLQIGYVSPYDLMSRLSPFANTTAPRGRKKAFTLSNPNKSWKFERWFSLIDAATLSRKSGLPPLKKLQNSLFLSSELHRTLYGFIVFEVAWTHVRGMNYLNELQTDTSLAIEVKFMQRWEFDSIAQAASCMSLWFCGTPSELLHLKKYLDSAVGEIFYDAEEDFLRIISAGSSSSIYHVTAENRISEPHTPPSTGPYKRRKIAKSISTGVEVDFYSEEIQSGNEDSLHGSRICSSDCESIIESKQYQDVLILFRFNDRDLPFKLKDIVMSDLRLLTLSEAGLPSWVIFLQSYPGFCHLYRPWMCPLARALYVLISIITVLVGFYDLYKHVPVLKATASRLCGPLFDWIETWEMVSRIKYWGTMLILHNFEKAVTWFLRVKCTAHSFFSVFVQPVAEPHSELLVFLLPMWTMFIEVVESLCSFIWVVIETSCGALGNLIEVILWPFWFIISIIWVIGTSILYPIFWIQREILYAPIHMIFSLCGFSLYLDIRIDWGCLAVNG